MMINFIEKSLKMFNGIIFHTGKVKNINKSKKSIFIGIETKIKFKKKDIGSSVSCDGVCLTIVKIKKNVVFFYVSNETLNKTIFKKIKINQTINLEKSITYGQMISGHFTQGHVDTIAKINKIFFIDKTWLIRLKLLNKNLRKFLINKASISINGVSLTISKVTNDDFEINVIPHTLKLTNLKRQKVNDLVNVELDIFSKYIYKYSN
jgi:riboflavin synthase